MSSSRRVKKGSGRRPQSAKRQRFMELRERGWSIRGAAREVGVARTTGANWARGYKTYRNGKVVGFVPAFVGGHENIPTGGHGFSPTAAMKSPH